MIKMIKCGCGTRINELNLIKHIESSSHKNKILTGRKKTQINKRIIKPKIILNYAPIDICFELNFNE